MLLIGDFRCGSECNVPKNASFGDFRKAAPLDSGPKDVRLGGRLAHFRPFTNFLLNCGIGVFS